MKDSRKTSNALLCYEDGSSGIRFLEADYRAEFHFQIIASATVKIDRISSVEPQSKRSPEAFHTHSRIQRGAGIARSYTSQSANEASRGIFIASAEIYETTLNSHEVAKR